MTRDEIYRELNEERFEIARRECTTRIMFRTDFLLDQLLELQHLEALEMLEETANCE